MTISPLPSPIPPRHRHAHEHADRDLDAFATFTPTFTITLTPTRTPTSTPTMTPTATSTPGVFEFSVSPKPDARGLIKFSWGTTIPADEASLKVFTSGFRVVREFFFNKGENPEYLSSGTHDFSWDGRDDQSKTPAAGNLSLFSST